ncbi:hypothetical protein ATANTOWER_009771 [Ataeniobius toweri]|uniref:Uncharacterized protein n=1 Tax=Ataeniobius toweri TaxID=208326 RepID=A0ABU7C2E7_9TELE|nr:hypothetical protein [Ataeniobius toweri]
MREAVISSFTVPQVQSDITQAHTSVYHISVPLSSDALTSIPSIRAHLAIAATPEKPIQTAAPHRHGMLAKGDGVLSGATTSPHHRCPSCCLLAFTQQGWCPSWVARQHSDHF